MRANVRTSKLAVAAAAMATAMFLAGPAFAGQRGGSHQGGGHAAPQHAAPARSAPAPRYSAPQHMSAPAPVYRQSAPLQQRGAVAVPRFESNGQSRVVLPSRGGVVLPSREFPSGRSPIGVAVPRPIHPVVSVGVGRPIFNAPYYAFRQHFNLGFGLFVGYPVAFPLGYSPYYYGYDPYAYGYYGIQPSYPAYPDYEPTYPAPTPDYSAANTNIGGLSFDIQPVDAAVFIDSKYVGTVTDFNPQAPPLTLPAGKHHVDLRAQGFQTMSFDITVVAGQVIPYQGAMSVIK